MAEVFTKLSRRIALGLGAILVLAACSLGSSSTNTTASASSTDVTQWVAWGGAELKAYRDVLAPFEASTGIKVHITTNRDSTNQIANGIDAGTDLPDLAPSTTDPIQLKAWVDKGALKPLEKFLDMSAYTSGTYPAQMRTAGAATVVTRPEPLPSR